MAFGFSRYDLNEITRHIELPELSSDSTKPLTLIVRYAGLGNRDWESAMMRIAAAKTSEQTDRPRDEVFRENAEIMAGSAIVGWQNVFDDEAADPSVPVPFSVEVCQRMLIEMQSKVWDVFQTRVWTYVRELKNFRSTPVIDADALGKK